MNLLEVPSANDFCGECRRYHSGDFHLAPVGDLRALAEKITKGLFVNGFGQEAERLVMELLDGSDAGGWSLLAVIYHVEQILRAEL